MDIHDTLLMIMVNLDIKNLLNTCMVNKLAHGIYQSELFWSYKFKEFPFYYKRLTAKLLSHEYKYCQQCLNNTVDIMYCLKYRSIDIIIDCIGDLQILNDINEDIISYILKHFTIGYTVFKLRINICYYKNESISYYLLKIDSIFCKKTETEIKNIIYLANYYGKAMR